jgi:hypothetical protein
LIIILINNWTWNRFIWGIYLYKNTIYVSDIKLPWGNNLCIIIYWNIEYFKKICT